MPFNKRFQELDDVIQQCSYRRGEEEISSEAALETVYAFLREVRDDQGVVYFIGNGGSAGIASHFCNDFLKTLNISAMTLFDSNIMSCFSNDYGYEYVFSKPLNILMKPSDLLIAISSSGNSQNILNAVEVAQEKNAKVITLSGFLPHNRLRQEGDLNFWVDVADYGLVETAHFFLLHTIVDLWNNGTYSHVRENQISSRN